MTGDILVTCPSLPLSCADAPSVVRVSPNSSDCTEQQNKVVHKTRTVLQNIVLEQRK